MTAVTIADKKSARICQGDVYKEVEYIESINQIENDIEIKKICFPYVIVLTQDCDLASDFRLRCEKPAKEIRNKLLLSVLVAPLYNVEQVCRGEHLSRLEIQTEPITNGSTEHRYLVSNQRPRYHYIEFPLTVPITPSVIDFTHYFSVDVNYLGTSREAKFVYPVSSLYREDISQRFTAFLARIGLPDPPLKKRSR